MKSPETYSASEGQPQEGNTMTEAQMQKLGASLLEDSIAGTQNESLESFESVTDKLPESESLVQEVSGETLEELREKRESENKERLEKVRQELNFNLENSATVPPEIFDGDNGDGWEGEEGGGQGNLGNHIEYHTTINNIHNGEREIQFKICERCLGSGRRWASIPLIPCPACHGRGGVSDLGSL